MKKSSFFDNKQTAFGLSTIGRVGIVLALLTALSSEIFAAQKTPKPVIPPGIASAIVDHLMVKPETAWRIKEITFSGMKKDLSRKYAATARSGEDKQLFLLLYDSLVWVPDNLTDADLAALASQTGKNSILRQASKKPKTTPLSKLQNLEHFTPSEAVTILSVVSQPCFVRGDLPYGAPTTTWASDSYWNAFYEIRRVEFARRSTILRLLCEEGTLRLPSSVDILFVWSGASRVTMQLQPMPSWSGKDAGRLKKLLRNPLYADMAQRQLAKMGK